MNIEINPMHKLLFDNGFIDGWAMTEETLIIWEHDEKPPAPLKRPKLSDEIAPVAD
jgi:hypothetical protein